MDTVNVIFDSRHTPQDYERLLGEFITQGITKFKFWDAVVLTHSVIDSIAASHKMIVQDAKDRGLKECIVLEQDAAFTSPNAWKYFVDNKPKDFDLYLWGSLTVPISNKIICGFQLYIISGKFYDTFLAVKENQHIDTAMNDVEANFHFCYPFPCLQRVGFSANNNEVVDYTKGCGITEQDIYRG